MQLTMYQVDAFAERVFEGNPAAVCPLDAWLPDALLQAIAEENNLAETAFFVPKGDSFHLRWFTPKSEEELCGHATLASAAVLFDQLGYAAAEIRFETRSGELRVRRTESQFEMTFPALEPAPYATPAALIAGLGLAPSQTLAAMDYIAVYEAEDQIRAMVPDYTELAKLDRRGVVATAPGREVDFVSRFFAPNSGIPEDPVTGSAHCELAPFWGERLGRTRMKARQLSPRGGSLTCTLDGAHVLLTGSAVHYMKATISVPDESGHGQFESDGQHFAHNGSPVEGTHR